MDISQKASDWKRNGSQKGCSLIYGLLVQAIFLGWRCTPPLTAYAGPTNQDPRTSCQPSLGESRAK